MFNKNYQEQTSNVTINFVVSNSVSAPANAMATNTNSDNDMITNSAMNVGGRKRKKREESTIVHSPLQPTSLSSIQPTKVMCQL